MAPTLLPESLASIQAGTCFWRRKNSRRTKTNMFPETYGDVSRGVVAFALLTLTFLLVYHAATDSFGFLPFLSLNKYRSPDVDIMWFKDPFPRFNSIADFQISCDHYWGSSTHVKNAPNTGFKFLRSNLRTIEFYKYWYASREKYPGQHDQDVFSIIKSDAVVQGLRMKVKFLGTAYFGGLCEPSRDLNLVCVMHANCCYGLNSKLHDLRIMLQDWKNFVALTPTLRKSLDISWRVPQNCSLDALQGDDYPLARETRMKEE